MSTDRTNHHAGLDRDDIVATALRMVEADGAQALSMRKLAAELGVTPTTIYWHVGSRDDVIAAVAEAHGTQLGERAIDGTTGRERVLSAARNVWSSALDHPEVMRLAYAHSATAVLEMQLEQALARELAAAGVHGEAARDALRSILLCVGGFLVLALRDADQIPTERASTTLWAAVDDPAIQPETVAALSQPIDLPALFETTITHLVAAYVPA